MGRYINVLEDGTPLPAKNKAQFLINHGGATQIPTPTHFEPNLVCVCENGPFDAAAYAYCEEEMKVFKMPDTRNKIWLLVPNAEKIAL